MVIGCQHNIHCVLLMFAQLCNNWGSVLCILVLILSRFEFEVKNIQLGSPKSRINLYKVWIVMIQDDF